MLDVMGLLAELVATPSVSGQEEDLATALANRVAGLGFNVQRHLNNLFFEVGQGGPRLLLHSHLDTVPACAGWNSDPWTPLVTTGRLQGLGANDAKGCVVAIMAAAAMFRDEPRSTPGTLVVALTAEEETGGANGFTATLPRLLPLDAAVFGEPTGLAPCTAQGGMLLLNCRAQGRSGHVAHAERLGLRNAIQRAAQCIVTLDDLRFEDYLAPDGSMQRSQAQVTLISGGISANQVPDSCEFRVDLRTTPAASHEQLLSELSRVLDCEVECLSQRYRPVATEDSAAIVKAALASAGKPAFYSPTVSDWSLAGGLPAVKLGPGESTRSHQPDEYIYEHEVREGAACYLKLLHHYFEGAQHGE